MKSKAKAYVCGYIFRFNLKLKYIAVQYNGSIDGSNPSGLGSIPKCRSHDSFESSPVKNNKNFQYRGDGEKESRKGHYLEISYGSNNLRTHMVLSSNGKDITFSRLKYEFNSHWDFHWFVHSMIKMYSLVAKH